MTARGKARKTSVEMSKRKREKQDQSVKLGASSAQRDTKLEIEANDPVDPVFKVRGAKD